MITLSKGTYRRRLAAAAVLVALVTASAVGVIPAQATTQGTTTRASVASDGSQANEASVKPTMSADGRYVAFTSSATNLVASDTNNLDDIFVHDGQTGETTRVSVASDGSQAVQTSGAAWNQDSAISPDGRFVAFVSTVENLVAGNPGSYSNLYVHDRVTGVTTREAPLDFDRTANPVFSADGRYLAFHTSANTVVSSDTNNAYDVFVRDRQTGATTRVSVPDPGPVAPPVGLLQANGDSTGPSISGDGRYVAFSSDATNLIGPNGDTNSQQDVFVHDRQTGTTSRVSIGSDGAQGTASSRNASINADGRFVAFETGASNLVPSDTNLKGDVLLRDRANATTSRVSVAGGGAQSSGASDVPSISGDGRYVAFRADDTNLVSGDTNGEQDIFLRDRQADVTTRVSVASDGTQANKSSEPPNISGDGRFVAFDTLASNLVVADTNAVQDVFVHDTAGATLPPAVSVADASVVEGDSGTRQMAFTVSLDRPADSAVTVAYATADGTAVAPGDYQATSGTVNFAPGTTVQSVEVAVNGDTVTEGDETFTLTISAPTGATIARTTAMGTILEDEPVLTIGDVAVYEGDAGTRGAVFTVSLSRPAPAAVAVAYATANGTALKAGDYTRTTGTLNFAAGTTSLKVKVPVAGDTTDESNETFTVVLSNPQGIVVADGIGKGTILDDDPPSLSGRRLAIGDVAVYEGAAGTRTAVFTVSLSDAASSAITVNYATANGSAAAPGDLAPASGTLTLAAGTTSTVVRVTVNGDVTTEPNENFSVLLSNVSGPAFIADNSGTGTILNDD